MILSKIEIYGFKSFAKKTDLKFDGHITAIVGPNGCGKTNIVDALRWGLGEQRPSILRADHMENIIFGGAQSSRPLGMAEVAITFDNASHVLPIDYDEVTVTRRLYRSGESEYLLNKNPVRLKDITDMLMDTGIGADAYSVIELKMVEDILSEKAEDRRKLIEEAAGVTKYKHRLKAAIRKQEATQNDLLRVNDIIQEVERTVRSLQRQVAKARQYQNLEGRIRALDLARSARLRQALMDRLGPLREQISAMQAQRDGRTTTLSAEEAGLETLRLDLVEREKALVQAQEALGVVVERIHKAEADIRVGEERIASLQDRIERYGQEVESLKKRLEDQKSHLDLTHRDREALQVKITSTGRHFNNKKMELEVFQQGLNLKRLDLNKKKKEIIDCFQEINRLGSDETRMRAKNDNIRGRLERLDEEDLAFQSLLKDVDGHKNRIDGELRDVQAEWDRIVSALDRTVSEMERGQQALDSEKERFFRDQGELDVLKARQSFLKNILESREGVSDGSKRLLALKPAGLLGILADLVETASPHRTAVESGLGEAARCLLFETWTQALDALDAVRQTGGGRVSMIALDRLGPLPARPRPVSPSGAVWADEVVRMDGRLHGLVRFLLGDLLIVESLDDAKAALDAMPDGVIRAVTPAGELVSTWGMVHAGDGSENETGMIGRRQRIEELDDRIRSLVNTLSEDERRLAEFSVRKKTLLDEKDDLENARRSVEEKKAHLEKQRDKFLFEKEKSNEGLNKNAAERSKLLQEIENGKEILEDLRPKLESLGEQREAIEVTTGQIQADVDRLEEEEKKMAEDVHKFNIAVVRLNGEAQNLDFDVERSQKLIQEIESTIAQRLADSDTARQDIGRSQGESQDIENRLLQGFAEKETLEAQKHEREADFHRLREAFQAKEREIRDVRHARDEVSEKIHALEMDISELEHQMKSLRERIWDTYQADIETIPVETAPVETVPFEAVSEETPSDGGEGEAIDGDETGQKEPRPVETDTDASAKASEETGPKSDEDEIERLKRRMKSLGPVNLVALQEFEQEKQRLDFLTKQRDDLLSAEETLKETIIKINQTARERFVEVFSQIRKNFKDTFGKFFHGGEADLRLPENEDVLEAQIEIMARPAGKQLRALDLLSGGEKALTAISLLFALYLVKPSPFCILDEIDAPLDDVNVDRFTDALKDYAEKTQFVMVTHNKRTMKSAKALYGVTMEEEGVSKLVSVKFEEAT